VTTDEFDASGNPVNLVGTGSRAVIGGSCYDWYGTSAGGVAYVNTFGQAYYEPAYLFQKELGSSAKYMAEAISHGAFLLSVLLKGAELFWGRGFTCFGLAGQ